MKIRIVWTEEDINHIRKHNIEPGEIESIFESKIYYRRRGNFYDFLGRTRNGRFLFVVFERLEVNTYRVVMARGATISEKNLYVKRAK
jgi:uncharacterized DUF497 family protein